MKAILIFACVILCMSACEQKTASIFEGYGDVGNPTLAGSFNYDASTKTYTLTGGGINIWDRTDQFFYAWKKVTGDFSMSAKVAFEGKGVNAHRKIGIMIRETLTGESKYADIAIHGDGLTSLQYRAETGGTTKEETGPAGGNHILLEKSGTKIRMKTATDTFPTNVTAEIELDFPGEFYVGLFICSHEDDVLETAFFSEVSFQKQ
jgi:hypothetical protein